MFETTQKVEREETQKQKRRRIERWRERGRETEGEKERDIERCITENWVQQDKEEPRANKKHKPSARKTTNLWGVTNLSTKPTMLKLTTNTILGIGPCTRHSCRFQRSREKYHRN